MVKRAPIETYCEKKISTLQKNAIGMIDYIDISSVDNTKKKIISFQTMNAKDAPSRAKQLLKKDDILVSTVRPNLNAVAVVESETDNLMVGSTGYCVLRCKDNIDFRYLFNFCQSQYFIDDMSSQATGASYPAVSTAIVRSSLIPSYPVDEQRRIASELDKVKDLIDKRKEQLEKLDELVKARFVELFGDLRTNEKEWEIKTFSELAEIITDGEHSTPRRVAKGIYLLSARNVLNHSLQLDDVDYIDEDEYLRISKRIIPQKGDVLISCSGTVGRCCSVPENLKFQMVRSVAIVRFKNIINPIFAEYMITSDYLQEQINGSKTMSSQANLFQGKIAKLKGFVPPIELQEKFVSFIKQTDKSKLEVQKSLEKLELLKKALMQKYFW